MSVCVHVKSPGQRSAVQNIQYFKILDPWISTAKKCSKIQDDSKFKIPTPTEIPPRERENFPGILSTAVRSSEEGYRDSFHDSNWNFEGPNNLKLMFEK
jgi:hypothetical protein